MKNVLVISNYWHFPFEKSSSRYNSVIELLSKNPDLHIELITSNFRHITKSQRNYSDKRFEDYNYETTLISEPGYNKNVSLKRIISHKIFAKNLKKYLNTKKDVDIIYSFVPSLSANKTITDYCRKNKIQHIIDVLDLWPESFQMVVKNPIISKILFSPMEHRANYIYTNADAIIAVSNTFLNRALSKKSESRKSKCIYIGTDLDYFDKCKKNNIKKRHDRIIRVVYIGTIGHSYDIETVIDSMVILNKKGIKNIKFVVIGDGPLKESMKEYALDKEVDCEFLGNLKYEKMVGELCSCDIAIHPIVGHSVSSITNKACDYAASGLPVINTQRNKEYRDLVEKYHAGLNCDIGDAKDIADKIEQLVNSKRNRIIMGNGNRKLAEDLFDRNKTYDYIISLFNVRGDI